MGVKDPAIWRCCSGPKKQPALASRAPLDEQLGQRIGYAAVGIEAGGAWDQGIFAAAAKDAPFEVLRWGRRQERCPWGPDYCRAGQQSCSHACVVCWLEGTGAHACE